MNEALVEALNAERYGPSLWWHRETDTTATDDNEHTCARRRRQLADDYNRHNQAKRGAA